MSKRTPLPAAQAMAAVASDPPVVANAMELLAQAGKLPTELRTVMPTPTFATNFHFGQAVARVAMLTYRHQAAVDQLNTAMRDGNATGKIMFGQLEAQASAALSEEVTKLQEAFQAAVSGQ